MKSINKFIIVLSIAVVALLLEFILKEPYYAKILITVTGIIMSVILLKGMIDVLRSGNFGVDILAISAIAATLAVGNYWAALIILIMITGGDSLEDYAQKKARKDLKSLLDNTPRIAHKKIGNDLNDVPVDDIKIGDIIIVKPKETVPVDGILENSDTGTFTLYPIPFASTTIVSSKTSVNSPLIYEIIIFHLFQPYN